jgi:hypothetical protein
LILIVWGLSSVSQSFAAAKQAEATIKAAQAAQTASAGNLVTIIVVGLLVIVFLAIGGYLVYLFIGLRIKNRIKADYQTSVFSGPNALWGKMPSSSSSAGLLQAMNQLISLEMMQVLLAQQQRHDSARSQELQLPGSSEQDADDNFWPPNMWTN